MTKIPKTYKELSEMPLDEAFHAMRERMDQMHEECYNMSAEITWKDRLIELYEKELPLETINSIKDFIFSEDDR